MYVTHVTHVLGSAGCTERVPGPWSLPQTLFGATSTWQRATGDKTIATRDREIFLRLPPEGLNLVCLAQLAAHSGSLAPWGPGHANRDFLLEALRLPPPPEGLNRLSLSLSY